jgi:drug/metabolite transporter (DMT)-like permease
MYIAMSVTASIIAIKLSAASYVSIISLLAPILMLILSARMVGDKITPRALAGISLAGIGAIVTILLPIAVHQGSHFVFYPLATLFALINTITFPLSTIYFKKANEKGMPFMPLMGIAAIIVVVTNLAIAGVADGALTLNLAHQNWWAVLYSGVAVAFVARTLNNLCYEHIGAAAVGALNYVGTFFAILIPVFVLGETLSMTMIIGGILMFLGVYVIQHHKSKHHRHYHMHINH